MKANALFDASQIEIKEDVSELDEILEYEQIILKISKAIYQYRCENDLTQTKLAQILDVNQVMISKLERGTYNPTIKLLYTLSRKLTKSSEWFIQVLKDIIQDLYKNKNIKYDLYEIYQDKINTEKKNNITYMKSGKNTYGGIFNGEIYCPSRHSIVR